MENNLRAVVNKIEQAVRSVDYNMGSFFYGDIYNINHLQEVKYPAVIVTNSTHTSKSDYITYNFNIFYVDRLTADKSNKLDVQSMATISLNNALQVLDDGYIVNDNWEIHTFEEKFNDVCAGAYINVGIQCPIELCSAMPTRFWHLDKVTDYLYKGTWDLLDYNFANSYFKRTPTANFGACSSVRAGNYYGRNFDWKYSELADVIVNTGYVLGVCGGVEGLTAQFIDSKQDSDLYKILPFFLQDGINKDGLVMNLNVVPKDKGDNSVVNRKGTKEVCSVMLVRYILDRCKTVDEAISLLREIRVFTPASLDYDLHYMIADENKTIVVEFIEGEYNFIEHNKLTNFHISGVDFLKDGKVLTQYQIKVGETPSKYGITPYASGLERYNLMVEAELAGYDDVRELMNKLYYTNTYSKALGSTFWYSEFVGGSFTTDTLATSTPFKNFINAKKAEYNNRVRDGKTWQTTHSSIYSFSNRTLRITAQEGNTVYEYKLGVFYPLIEIDTTISKSTTIETPADYYGISKVNIEIVPDHTKEIELITGKITDYVIPDGITSLKSYALAYCNFESVTIPSTLKSLPQYCFYQCSKLKTINNVENLTTLNSYSFQYCTALERITLPNVTTISSYSFRYDTALKYVEFGSKLTSIGSSTFNGCTSLELVDLSKCTQVPTLSNTAAFTDVPTTCTIKVPAALYDQWITATNWSTIYSRGYNFEKV